MTSSKQVEHFDPISGVAHPTPADLHGLTHEEIANVLSQGHPKSAPVKTHPAMEGPRTGLPHVTPHSLRYQNAHATVGTSVPKSSLDR